MVGVSVSTGADTKCEHSGAAAHPRLVICVSLRMAASAEAPADPILFKPRLQRRDRAGMWRESKCVNGR